MQFVARVLGGWASSSGKGTTTISESLARQFANKVAEGKKINWDVLYANALAHEVFYGNLLNKADRHGKVGLKGSEADVTELLRIQADEITAIKHALGLD